MLVVARRRQLVGAEHPIDQVTQAIGLLDDHVGVVLQAFVRQLAPAAGRRRGYRQRVLDLVGQAAHQQFGGFLLGQLRLFLGDAQQAVADGSSSSSRVWPRLRIGVTA